MLEKLSKIFVLFILLTPIHQASSQEVSPIQKWKFAVISDLNGSYGSTQYSDDVTSAVNYLTNQTNGIQFVLSTGDMVAGQKANLNYKKMWNSFHSTVTRKLKAKGIPLYPSPGNHDAYLTYTLERDHYNQSWKNEDILSIESGMELIEGVEQNYPFNYAFTIGPALFIALDSTDPQPLSDHQFEWLEKVLELNKNISNKFIFSHIPMIPFAFKRELEYTAWGNLDFLKKLESLLEKYKVSAFLTGHSHVYYPGRRQGYTKYISVPLLGGGARQLITRDQSKPASKKGFLVFEYSKELPFEMKSLTSKEYKTIENSSLPAFLDMPEKDSSTCRYCSRFPLEMFAKSDGRVLYFRSDL